jgi:hypothetical protein
MQNTNDSFNGVVIRGFYGQNRHHVCIERGALLLEGKMLRD